MAMMIHGTRKMTPSVEIRIVTRLEMAGSSSLSLESSSLVTSPEPLLSSVLFNEPSVSAPVPFEEPFSD